MTTSTTHQRSEQLASRPGSAADASIDNAMKSLQVGTGRRTLGIIILLVVLFGATILSLMVGAKPIAPGTVLEAFYANDVSNTNHIIVTELRLPRTFVGLFVGAALGTAGALMQGVTRNPLADPGLLGVNAGAAFAVVLAIWQLGLTSVSSLIWFAFIGAAVTSVLVYALGSMGQGSATPVRLALSGAAVSALLGALTGAITLLDQQTLDRFRFWAVGSLAGRDAEIAGQMAPFLVVGLLLAAGVARNLNALALGEDTAKALGTKVVSTQLAAGLAITILCGTAVSAAGPIGFVGLVIPHMVRVWFGPDQRWLIPASALAGPCLLLICDVTGRVIARPGEIQVGIMTAAIGGPAFVFLVRRTRMAQL